MHLFNEKIPNCIIVLDVWKKRFNEQNTARIYICSSIPMGKGMECVSSLILSALN